MTWTIRRDGIEYAVAEGDQRQTVLTADGAVVSTVTAEYWGKVTLHHEDLEFVAQWGPTNTLTTVHLVEGDERTLLAPPPGSRAAKRERLAREHPVRFTLMRVGTTGAGMLIGLLGIGAALSLLLGRLLPSIDLPSIPWPDISPPDWLRYLDPIYWLSRLGLSWPDISLPEWLTGSAKYWGPLLIAALVALGQIDKRRKEDRRRQGDD